MKTETITILGDITNDSVRRVTFNDTDASVSRVDENFVMSDFPVKPDINNIVYKVYDDNNTLLTR